MKILSFSLMMSLTMTLLTVGIITATTHIPEAEAKRNCNTEGDTTTCTGGSGGGGDGAGGGIGGRSVTSTDESGVFIDDVERSGGFGKGGTNDPQGETGGCGGRVVVEDGEITQRVGGEGPNSGCGD